MKVHPRLGRWAGWMLCWLGLALALFLANPTWPLTGNEWAVLVIFGPFALVPGALVQLGFEWACRHLFGATAPRARPGDAPARWVLPMLLALLGGCVVTGGIAWATWHFVRPAEP